MLAKLIRTKWANFLAAEHGQAIVHVTPQGPEHRALLAGKLHEEAAEVNAAPWDVNEYGDLLEVLFQIAHYNGITEDQCYAAMLRKRTEKGGIGGGCIYVASREEHLANKARYT
jgi:predicted house-cleaning noncanonical NTP pyrophosphatase (MazG superfamily)